MKTQVLPENILRRMDPKDRAPMGKAGWAMPEIIAANAVAYEKMLHNLLMQYLNLHAIFFIHSTFGKRTTATPGTPDFVFAIDGQACAIELKSPNGELSPEQEKAIAAMRQNGWAIEICTSIQQAICFINRFKK